MHKRIQSLDGLRGIAILMVVIAHASETWPDSFNKWFVPFRGLGNGEFGVTIFFILSGYLITSILLREYDAIGRIDMKAFYMRRIFRIFPAFYFYFFFMVALDLFGAIHLPARDFAFAGTHLINYSTAIELAFKMPDLSTPDYWFVGHFWSLSMEEQFYWMWPVTLALLLWRRWWGVLVALILIMPLIRFGSYFVFPGLRGQIGIMLHTASDGIFSGCLMAILLVRRPELCRKLLAPAWAVALVPLYIYVLCPLLDPHTFRGYDLLVGRTLFIAAVGFFMINMLLQSSSTWYHRALEFAPLVFIGRISYSLYLWQQVFLTPLNKTWLGLWPINVAASFVAAYLSYRCIELPFIKLKDRLFPAHTKKVAPKDDVANTVPVPAA